MATVVEDNKIQLPTNAQIGIKILNKSRKWENVEIIELGRNKFIALFDRDDVDFKLCINNRHWCRGTRGLGFDVITLGKEERFYIKPDDVAELETLETKGRKLHFISQDSKVGEQLVGLAAKRLKISPDEASLKISTMELRFEVELLLPVSLQGKIITIFIKTLTGKTITIKTGTENLIEDVKRLIQISEGFPVPLQRLIFKGKQLEDEKTVLYHNIEDHDTLQVVLRLRGGGYAPGQLRKNLQLKKDLCNKNPAVAVENKKRPVRTVRNHRRGAICFGKKSNQTFTDYDEFDPDPSVVIEPIIIEFQIRTELSF